MFTDQVVNAVRKYIMELAENSTQIEINKYDVFKEVREREGLRISYKDYREAVSEAIFYLCEEKNWDVNASFIRKDGKTFANYIICTETNYAHLGTRKRWYISADALRKASILPGDTCICHLVDNDGKLILYVTDCESSFKPSNTVKTSVLTVEKTGGARFTFPESILYFNPDNVIVC